ncbi:MAG: radical SAM protein [Alphaproteobacteria bacterium]|nr:radical SAM protein [Alphaproteobacteria bacterium]
MINLINAASDIINSELYNNIINSNFDYVDKNIIDKMIMRKYIFNNYDEYQNFLYNINNRINLQELNSNPVFLIIPTYNCNLNCTYCYEQSYNLNSDNMKENLNIFDKELLFIDKKIKELKIHNVKKVKVILMGGEPLLKSNKELILKIFKEIYKKGYSLDIITNGVHLNFFIDDLIKYNIREIQVTVDGSKEIHDKRRVFKNGSGSFDVIMSNIYKAISKGIVVNLRVNVDNSNIDDLPKLANILVKRFDNNKNLRPYLYLLQDGGCSGDRNILNEEAAIMKICKQEVDNENMRIFDKKYHGSNFINSIFENKTYHPVLRHCGASKNQYILDYRGDIYKCWHGIGCNNYKIGGLNNGVKFNKDKKISWENRNVLHFDKCLNCKYRYICGTGCPGRNIDKHGNQDLSKENCIDYKTILKTLVLTKIKQ